MMYTEIDYFAVTFYARALLIVNDFIFRIVDYSILCASCYSDNISE